MLTKLIGFPRLVYTVKVNSHRNTKFTNLDSKDKFNKKKKTKNSNNCLLH